MVAGDTTKRVQDLPWPNGWVRMTPELFSFSVGPANEQSVEDLSPCCGKWRKSDETWVFQRNFSCRRAGPKMHFWRPRAGLHRRAQLSGRPWPACRNSWCFSSRADQCWCVDASLEYLLACCVCYDRQGVEDMSMCS